MVNQQGVAELTSPTIPVQDVEVNGTSVVNAQGVAEIPAIPDEVVANPSGTASANLTKLKVGNNIYEVGSVQNHIYSTSEQRIGTWIDGKPLYEKTVNFGALPNATVKQVAHNIADVDRIWIAGGYARNGSNFHNQLNLSGTASISSQWYMGVNLTVIQCETGSNRTGYTECYVVLHYTKTTDSV